MVISIEIAGFWRFLARGLHDFLGRPRESEAFVVARKVRCIPAMRTGHRAHWRYRRELR